MPDDDILPRLKQTSVFIRSPDGSTGSGYLVAPQRIGTAAHVVREWQPGQSYEVLIGVGSEAESGAGAGVGIGVDWPQKVRARLLKTDPVADAAVLAFDEPLAVEPLPVADRLDRKAAWDGYGFPGLAGKPDAPSGLSIDGHVQDPRAVRDAGQAAVLLYSQEIAAGNASPLHGFSGSPVTVDGALVGHLVKHIGDPDDRRRAAFGYVYACPIDAVLALLDVAPKRRGIAPQAIETLAGAVPPVGADDYHVFVSYRSTDRPWALSLVARLEGVGLRVFIDQRELEVGGDLAGQLQSALQRSRAAVVLVSRGWIESPWCQQEASVLVKRAVEDASFRLVPLRLDDSPMPLLLDSRVWLDFEGTARAEGENVDRLINALLGRLAPPAQSPAGRAETAEREVIDKFVARVRSAVMSPADGVDRVLDEWRKTALSDVAPLIAAAEVLIGRGEFEHALEVLKSVPVPPSVRVRQLRALATRKAGRIDDAVRQLEELQRDGNLDPETAGLLAGSYKAYWLRTGNAAFRERSYRLYREAFERSGDSYNGINAASMALQCGDMEKMYEFAGKVIETLEKRPVGSLDHWELATLGEAYLLRGRMDTARDWYRSAVARAAGLHQDIAVMRRQARRNLEKLGRPHNLFDDVLPVPRVLAYCGHMVDAPGRTPPRFPAAKVGAVVKAIKEKLDRHGYLHGFGSAARGTDLLFLEELVARGLSATVVLPFPEADFIKTSVGGGNWNQRLAHLRDPSSNVKFVGSVLDAVPPAEGLPDAFAEANREIQRRALECAGWLDEVPVVIAVWDGQPGDGPGGTADTVALWQERGFDVEVIDLTRL